MTDLRCEIRLGPPGRAGRRPEIRAGESVLVAAHFLDDAGVLLPSASGIWISATDPLGETTTWSGLDLAVVALGAVQRQVSFTLAGTWVLRAGATSPNETVAELVVRVAGSTAVPIGPVTPSIEQALAATIADFDQRISLAAMTYVIRDVGLPASAGQIPDWDDAPAINAAIQRARTLGFYRIATRGVICRIASRIDSGGVILSNGPYGDVPESDAEWRATPRWVFADGGWILGDGKASGIEDFSANHEAYSRVENGVLDDVDPVSMAAAMDHMTGAYGLSGVNDLNAENPVGRYAVTLQGDGCRAVRFRLLGFRRSIITDGGARCAIQHYRIDGGGTAADPGVGIAMVRSGGSPDHGPGFIITMGIKKVRGVSAIQMPILAAAQDVATGKTRVTLGWVRVVKYPFWRAGTDVKANASGSDIVVTKVAADYRQWHKKDRGRQTTGSVAPGTGVVSPVVGDTYSDGEVDWIYDGPYVGRRIDANYPATFLKAGHRLVLGVDPKIAQLTPAGLAETDLGKRGHVGLLGFGAGDADAFSYVVDVPWNAAFATAWVGGWIGIFPALRIGTGWLTDESDGFNCAANQVKGFLIAARLYASNGVWQGASVEDGAEGENTDGGNPWAVGYYCGPGSQGMVFVGGSFKSVDIPFWVATGSEQSIITIKELFGGGVNGGVFVEDGWFAPAGGFFRGGKKTIYLGDKGFADLSALQTDAGTFITGTSGFQNRVVLPRFQVSGPAKGETRHSWPGDAVFGPNYVPTRWSAIESIATVNLYRMILGVEGDLWRVRPTQTGTTGATEPLVQRSKKLRQNSTAYGIGKSVYLIGADSNYHHVVCIARTGDGLTAASQPAVTDATTTYTDGNSTWQRIGRYLGPEAPIADGSVIWQVIGPETGMAQAIRWDAALRRIIIAYVPNNAIPQDRLIADDQGVGLGGAVRHIDTGFPLVTAQGLGTVRSRTDAQLPAGVVGTNPLAHVSDRVGGARLEYRIGTGAWQGLREDGPRLQATSTGTTPVRLTTDGAAIAADRSNIGPTVASGAWLRVGLLVRLARTSGGGAAGDFAEWDVTLTLDRPGNANSTRVTGAPSAAAPARAQGLGAATLTITADTTADAANRNGLNVTVSGVAGVTATAIAFTETR